MRFSLQSFLLGILVVPIAAGAGGYAALRAGVIPANADATPGAFERWAARTSLNTTVLREAPAGPGPVAVSDATLTDGARLYAQNCAVCHGVDHGDRTSIAAGLYQKPPQFAKHGVTDDPVGETYWKIEHGIRLTGMPAYAKSLSEKQKWEIALFLKHMDALPPQAEAAWTHMRVGG